MKKKREKREKRERERERERESAASDRRHKKKCEVASSGGRKEREIRKMRRDKRLGK